MKVFTTKSHSVSKFVLTFVLAMLSCVYGWSADSKWTNGGTFNETTILDESVIIPEGITVVVNGNLTIVPKSNADIKLTISGELIVTGTITLSSYDRGRMNNPRYRYGNLDNNGSVEAGNIDIGGVASNCLNKGTMVVKGNISNSGRLTNNGDLTIDGNLNNKAGGYGSSDGVVNVVGNVIVNGNVTNGGDIYMKGGILRVGTLESGKLKENTGELTLNNGSSLLYDNNEGRESYVEVRGDLNGGKSAAIKSTNSGKGKLAVVGTYYDEVQEYSTYHPDWGVKYTYSGYTVVSVSYEKKSTPDVLLSAKSYSITPKNTGSDNFVEWFASSFFGYNKFSDAAKVQLEEIVKQYKSINPENLVQILQEISSLLPITLNYFTASQSSDEIAFEWQTASEVNNDFFTIEYSIDGVHFNELLREDGNGTTSETNDYYATASAENFAGITYFRLKQTDFNGEYSYSDVVYVAVESNETDLYVFPNPTTDYITVAGNPISAYVSDTFGRNMSCVQTSENTFDVAGLSVGTYYVVVTTRNGKKVLPFVKK